jgi:DNA invertase Pin-like site-specific DNA recombinase|tara:strand:+ start:180 stop:878 length:699 start_codon:yes stop_codon:yes gene_type:complete
MKKVIAYIRVSTMSQGISMKKQKADIKQYCKDTDLDLFEMISEEGVSGSAIKRNGFTKLMDMIKNKEIDGVVVYWISRAGRTASETLQLINDCLANDITLISIKEGIDTSNAGGRMQAKMLAVWAEEELIQIRERIKDAISYKKSNGLKYNGNEAYGTYVKNGLIYEHKNQMSIVKNIKNWRSRGWTWYKCMKVLNERDIPTKKNTGKGWTINQIKQVYKFHYEGNAPVLIR